MIGALLSVRAPWVPTRSKKRLDTVRLGFGAAEGDLVTLLNVWNQARAVFWYEGVSERTVMQL